MSSLGQEPTFKVNVKQQTDGQSITIPVKGLLTNILNIKNNYIRIIHRLPKTFTFIFQDPTVKDWTQPYNGNEKYVDLF